jgi:GlpG protein
VKHIPYWTLALIFACLGVAAFTALGNDDDALRELFIAEPGSTLGQTLASGELWRLITPIFLHFGVLHLLFNMMWVWDLGREIEKRNRPWFLPVFVALIGVAGNLAQYFASGPAFGGMSGVVYGLIAYIWIRNRLNAKPRYELNQFDLVTAVIWYFACWTGALGPIGNWDHTAGLVGGLIWGYLDPVPVRKDVPAPSPTGGGKLPSWLMPRPPDASQLASGAPTTSTTSATDLPSPSKSPSSKSPSSKSPSSKSPPRPMVERVLAPILVSLIGLVGFGGLLLLSRPQQTQQCTSSGDAIALDEIGICSNELTMTTEPAARVRLLIDRGNAYRATGQIDPAIKDYEAALTLDPDNAHALAARGVTERQARDTARGKADIARARELDAKIDNDNSALRYWDLIDAALNGVPANDKAAIDVAMRAVLRGILAEMPATAPSQGTPNARSIQFRTNAPGVVISQRWREQSPEETSVILQYQYRDLLLGEQAISVSVSVGGIWETIAIPWTAIKGFDDRTAYFGFALNNADATK